MLKKLLTQLQELISIQAVSAKEKELIKYLWERSKKRSLQTTIDPEHWVIIWNPEAETYVMAHIDEVGWVITYSWEDWIHFDPVGWLPLSAFIWRDIEISTSHWLIPWLIISSPLQTQASEVTELNIIVDPQDIASISWGDTFRFKTHWIERETMLFSSVLDNRLWVAQLLVYIDLIDAEKLSNVAFCFSTQEEVRNKWAIKLLQKYKPKKMIIFDILPYWLIDNLPMNTLAITHRTPDYIRSALRDNKLESSKYFDITVSNDELLRSEAMQFENVTWWVALHLFTPIYNYHMWTYAVLKQNIYSCTESSFEILDRTLLQRWS